MGLEKVVLNRIMEVNADIFDNAEFFNGSLFIRKDDTYCFMQLRNCMDVIAKMVCCPVEITESDTQYAIDFVI